MDLVVRLLSQLLFLRTRTSSCSEVLLPYTAKVLHLEEQSALFNISKAIILKLTTESPVVITWGLCDTGH